MIYGYKNIIQAIDYLHDVNFTNKISLKLSLLR
jgi:hypothetical protein